MEALQCLQLLLSLLAIAALCPLAVAGDETCGRSDGLHLDFAFSVEIVNNMAGFPGSDASDGCFSDSALGGRTDRCGIGIISATYKTAKYPDAPNSWPEGSSITGPFIWGSGWEYYIDLNNCGAPLPAAPLLHGARRGERIMGRC